MATHQHGAERGSGERADDMAHPKPWRLASHMGVAPYPHQARRAGPAVGEMAIGDVIEMNPLTSQPQRRVPRGTPGGPAGRP